MLTRIVRQAKEIADSVYFAVVLDPPLTPSAAVGLRRLAEELDPHEFGLEEARQPALKGGDRFMPLRNQQLSMLPRDCTHAVIWDDDHLVGDLREAQAAVRSGADLVYATKKFLWDDPRFANVAIPRHRSVFFFRHDPNDSFPTDRIIHAPQGVHDAPEGVVADLSAPLLDNGYLHRADRIQIFRDYTAAGKVDAATRPLVEQPRLQEVDYSNLDVTPEDFLGDT